MTSKKDLILWYQGIAARWFSNGKWFAV